MKSIREDVTCSDVCEKRLKRFRSNKIDINNKLRSERPKEFENNELQKFLDQEPARTLKEAHK